MSFDSILGQVSAIGLLDRMLASGRIPHAFVFQGPEGVGKLSTARMFASALLCETPLDGGRACAKCSACGRVERGSHPDVIHVTRLPKERSDELSAVISVKQIRDLVRLAGFAPREGSWRVFLIDPADRMNTEAQNALLKTLEEPPGQAVLILNASRPNLLLPTVRSRSFALRFSAMRSLELAALLTDRGMDPAEAAARAALAGGRPGAALSLDLPERRERREAVLEMLEGLAAGHADTLSEHSTLLAGKDEATLVDGLELMQALLRDAARATSGPLAETLVHADLGDRIQALGHRIGPRRAAELIRSADRARGWLRFNTQRVLVAEGLLAAVAGGPIP